MGLNRGGAGVGPRRSIIQLFPLLKGEEVAFPSDASQNVGGGVFQQ
jgi:hypothetical protein